MRHPWFASTMTSSSGTCSRTAAMTGRSTRQSCEWSLSLTARTPASCSAAQRRTRSSASTSSPLDAYARIRSRSPPRSRQRGSSRARPRRSQTATSTIQLRPWWKSTVSTIPWTASVSDTSRPTSSRSSSSRSGTASPLAYPSTRSSERTTTIVASWNVRGSGSHAARNGGSSGYRYRRVSIEAMFTRRCRTGSGASRGRSTSCAAALGSRPSTHIADRLAAPPIGSPRGRPSRRRQRPSSQIATSTIRSSGRLDQAVGDGVEHAPGRCRAARRPRSSSRARASSRSPCSSSVSAARSGSYSGCDCARRSRAPASGPATGGRTSRSPRPPSGCRAGRARR